MQLFRSLKALLRPSRTEGVDTPLKIVYASSEEIDLAVAALGCVLTPEKLLEVRNEAIVAMTSLSGDEAHTYQRLLDRSSIQTILMEMSRRDNASDLTWMITLTLFELRLGVESGIERFRTELVRFVTSQSHLRSLVLTTEGDITTVSLVAEIGVSVTPR